MSKIDSLENATNVFVSHFFNIIMNASASNGKTINNTMHY